MKLEKEKWVDQVFDSVKDRQSVKPSADLFARIEVELQPTTAKIIPLRQWRLVAAAAVVLLAVNLFTIYSYHQGNQSGMPGLTIDESLDQELISNYKLYD